MTHRRARSALPPWAAYGLIAAIVLVLLALFAFAGGWIGPSRVSGAAVSDALEYNAGRHAGYRRAHAKGLCISGTFEANGNGTALSRASIFKPGRYPVEGRFSIAGGNPLASDGRNVFHSMALILRTPDGQQWRTGMDHAEIFPVADVAAFVGLQRASRPDPATGKPDPDAMQAFLASHPEVRSFQQYMKAHPLPDAFTDGPYYSINAFRFTNAQGVTRFVRWAMLPEDPLVALDKRTLGGLPRDAVFDRTLKRLANGPARWHLIVTIADPGDITDKATVAWPAGRRTVDVGTLIIDKALPAASGGCRDEVFDPTILPPGIAPSDDPLLTARSAAYSNSFTRRASESARSILSVSAKEF
ncbi:catalase family peroxidase [Novosphingobium naphthalenivorans]|uniref:catalase family peroxidase n=1 Tax=Novosphingobium naphthalenivorans TaxID=273168 RepID=UPI00082969B5|nr:catalase family peroxidase [Novosphingobium naphthalenivorans]